MSTHNLCRVPDKCLSPLLSSSGHPETQTCPVKCVGSFISTDRAPLPELIPVTVAPGNNYLTLSIYIGFTVVWTRPTVNVEKKNCLL
jgi:hypothetical protein